MRGPVVVLGGYGETGRRLASLLSSRGTPVLVAGRDGPKAAALAARIRPTSRAEVTSAAVDASDRPRLSRLLEGVSLVVNATSASAPIRTVVGASLDAGVDVVDLQLVPRGTDDLRAMTEQVETAGRCMIAQAGFHPGAPAALARWAAGRMEDVDRVWAAGLLRARGGIPVHAGGRRSDRAFPRVPGTRARRRHHQARAYHAPRGLSACRVRVRVPGAVDDGVGPGRDPRTAAGPAGRAAGRVLHRRLRSRHRYGRVHDHHARAAPLRFPRGFQARSALVLVHEDLLPPTLRLRRPGRRRGAPGRLARRRSASRCSMRTGTTSRRSRPSR